MFSKLRDVHVDVSICKNTQNHREVKGNKCYERNCLLPPSFIDF